ncbi:MAG: radical SAM protein [Myxococcales bacterium]|nr:radical SAM protein [Myxococcales bacterium]
MAPLPEYLRLGKGDTLPHLAAPEVVGWETTLRCNMRCRHCGSTAGDARNIELSTAECLSLCRQIVDVGIPRVCLTGGETLLRPDWRLILENLLVGGVEVGLLTNGWLFTEKMLKELAAYSEDRFYISISLDGVDEVHDGIRCLPGSFERAFQGGLALKEIGIPVAVITTMQSANLDCLPDLRARLFEELQPYCWQLQVANSFGRAVENDDCRVNQVEYARAAVFACESRRLSKGTKTKVYVGDCLGYLGSLEGGLRDEPWPGCQAGLELIGIQSNGNIKGCLSIIDDRFVEGNALDEGIRKVWDRAGGFAFNRRFKVSKLRGVCAGCPVGERCRAGCTASAVSVNGAPHEAPFCLRAVEEGKLASAAKPAAARGRAAKRKRRQYAESRASR